MDRSILENYLSEIRSSKGDRELLKLLSSWDEGQRLEFLKELGKLLPSAAMPFAGKCLREKRSFQQLLSFAIENANASDMRYWIDCVVPRLGLDSVKESLEESRRLFPEGVKKAEYFLGDWDKEDKEESWLTNPRQEFLGRCNWEESMSKSKYLELNAAPGSSFDQIQDHLDSRKFCVCMIVNFTVFVHHSCYHGDLLKSVGAEWSESPGDGNFSVVDDKGSVVCRWKPGCDPLLSGFAEDLIREKFERKNCVEK